MPKVIEKLDLKRKGLYLFKQDNSPYWQLRLKIGKNKAEQCSTKLESKDEAIMFAIEKYGEYKEKLNNKSKTKGMTFYDVAQLVINDLEEDNTRSKKSLQNYKSIILKFTENFFKDIPISEINNKKIGEYIKWRKNEYGDLKKSTILKHNIALRKILNKSLDLEIPLSVRLENIVNDGVRGEKRKEISYEDYHAISDKIIEFICNSESKEQKLAFSLLHDAMDFILCTGIRPGKELHSIRWKDISVAIHEGKPKLRVFIQKSKTKERNSIISYSFISVLHDIAKRNPNRKADDYVFSLKNGQRMSDEFLGRKFAEVLESLKIKKKGDNQYTLYSLRHSFITWHAFKNTNHLSLAIQCGTSVNMVEQFYSHASEKIQNSNFGGITEDDDEACNRFVTSSELTEKNKIRINKYFLYLAENCLKRGYP